MIERLALIGVGLIGGSLARALKAVEAVGEIVGASQSRATLDAALALGVIDRAAADAAQAVREADLVVLATPVGTMPEVFSAIGPALDEGVLITDVGSVKGAVVAAARAALGPHFARFVPGHPIAGTERSGVEASVTDLFRDRYVILTPLDETDPQAVERVESIWEGVGAQVLRMSVERHDETLAATSHLPHMLAYALVELLARSTDAEAMFGLAAGGFYDFTRIASSDPVMWRDICIANRAAIAAWLRRYGARLEEIAARIEAGDGAALEALFRRAKHARDTLLPAASREASRE